MVKEDWQIRNVRYEEIHGISQAEFDIFAGMCMDDMYGHYPHRDKKGERPKLVVDLMSGYGALTRELVKKCERENIPVIPVLIDKYKEQIERSLQELRDYPAVRIVGDARDIGDMLLEDTVDMVMMKQGLHEIPRDGQQGVINGVHKVLKKRGLLYVWDMWLKDDTQEVFQEIMRAKDRLTGYQGLARDRYFLMCEEIMGYMEKAGFDLVETKRGMVHKLSTEKRLVEFCNDERKLEKWHEEIRKIVPKAIREKIRYNDSGENIEMCFREGVVRGRK